MRGARILVTCLLAASACTGRTGRDDPAGDPPLPNVVLETQDGRPVRFYDDLVKGRVVLINFMFTTCRRACPATTAHLKKVKRALGARVGRDVLMLSISLDPEHDTPRVLEESARLAGLGPGWTLLTGQRTDIERLRRTLGLYDLNPAIDADRTRHAGTVVLGNEPIGRWSAVSGQARPRQIFEAAQRVMLAPGDWKPATWSGGREPPGPAECAAPAG